MHIFFCASLPSLSLLAVVRVFPLMSIHRITRLPEDQYPYLQEKIDKGTTYFTRELPYSWDFLLENFMGKKRPCLCLRQEETRNMWKRGERGRLKLPALRQYTGRTTLCQCVVCDNLCCLQLVLFVSICLD